MSESHAAPAATLPWRSAAVTGASSGIGAALARALAVPGRVLHLAGRDPGRLAAVATACRAAGAEVREATFDVRDAAACEAWIDGAGRLDLVVANAGTSAGTGDGRESPAQVREVFAVNLDGALNVMLPAIEAMRAQGPGTDGVRGRVAGIASIAAFLASPGAPAYCASKAALQRWIEASEPVLRREGVRLHAVCPGFVRTPMTARNRFPMPFLMEAEEAARRTLAGIAAGRVRIVFPRATYAAARAAGLVPVGWLGGMPAKAAR
ncbi:SDR family NAD(P)-dependent oxidoreductase [Roseomonas sp. CCTCC AB2023176]|uniref:SDR family NAD(P)-dependent oxidoreductase n=1 Tax=Roseomonas sp. CCTCC AB2023176 TaxID=3342640 RepID=UPI0035DB3D16